MITIHMTGIFFHADGTPSAHPTDLVTATRLKKSKYDDRQVCPTCSACSIKFTSNSRCIHCARMEAIHFYNTVILGKPWPTDCKITDDIRKAGTSFETETPQFYPRTPEEAVRVGSPVWVRLEACSTAGHVGVRTLAGECYLCEITRASPARSVARRSGERCYTPAHACPDCGQHAQRRVHDDRCTGCHPTASTSPRQAAMAAGERWYTPTTPCPRCGTFALRHVDNGRCQGCRPVVGQQQTDVMAQLMAENPDMVIDRSDAKVLGLTVYRTGTACKRHHTGWRYVSTGGCIDCLKNRP